MPHQSSVVQYSRQAGIDPAWAYGIMRQESRFNIGARLALEQVDANHARHARYIARKLGNRMSHLASQGRYQYPLWYVLYGRYLNKLGGSLY